MNEYQERAKQRADEFAVILEAVMADLPGDWALRPWDGDGFAPRWRVMIRSDQDRELLAGAFQAAGRDRIEFKACGWPGYTDAAGKKCSQSVSNLWNPQEALPQCTAAIDREPRLIAKQIERFFPDYDRIYGRLENRATEFQTYEDRTASALRLLAEATGNQYKPGDHRGYFLRGMAETQSIEFNSVGDVGIRIPAEEMAEVIDLIYKLRTGKSRQQEKYFACQECGCTDVQMTAWLDVNSDIANQDEPPTDQSFCPQCEQDQGDGSSQKRRFDEVEKRQPFSRQGPECGHSACSQNYIDTGQRACVAEEGA